MLAGRKVLIVEDDYYLATDMVRTLGQAGAEIIGPVPSVRDALRLLAAQPEAAVLDVELQDGKSFPIADALTQRDIPFVFATGSVEAIPVEHRARPICPKPMSVAALLSALSEALHD